MTTMSSERVRELLKQLRAELSGADVDDETAALMRQLDSDIQHTLDASGHPGDALTERAKEVEVRFALNHPVAERIVRELVDSLAKIGV